MTDHDQDHDPDRTALAKGFWRSRVGLTLIVFLAVAAVLLGFEHRVHLFGGNALLALLLLGCIGMHFFMHGGHGGGDSSGDKS